MQPRFIGSEIYRGSRYSGKHPLSVPRVCTTMDLCRALGWFAPGQYVEAPMATVAQAARFHDPAYLAALRQAEQHQDVPDDHRTRFRLGADSNPIYPEMFTRPMIGAGATLLAAALTRAGGTVFAPGGGMHHGRADRAAGFCYLNDAVLGILAWLDAGIAPVVYLDIDAHHGDGVQDAFHDDPRVLTISIHEAGRWPRTGASHDRAGGAARNFPVPAGFNDTEMRHLMRHAVLPLIDAWRPAAIFLQCGADGLEEDPLARLALSNNAHCAVAGALMGRAPRLLVTGGGGYHPFAVARCWAAVWATLNGLDIPPVLPEPAQSVLRGLSYARAAGRSPPGHWVTTLRDAPREGMVRPEIAALAASALEMAG